MFMLSLRANTASGGDDMKSQAIPFVDLARQYRALKPRIDAAVSEVFETTSFVLGPQVEQLEAAIAELVGVAHGVGCGSGTDALVLALMAAGIGPGDEVVTTPWSFFATASAIVRVGATPVFVDIDPETFCWDPEQVLEAMAARPKVRAVIPVHLYGRVAPMAAVVDRARESGIVVIEDGAQALGASGPEGCAGGVGELGCFSFYPTKNLGACGDAGMVTTDSEEFAQRLQSLRWHGSEPPRSYNHVSPGLCSRLGGLAAAVLLVKLAVFDEANARRRLLASRYRDGLAGCNLILPGDVPGHVYHQFAVRVPKGRRDALRAHLGGRGVGCAVFYPAVLSDLPALKSCSVRAGDLPQVHRVANEVLCLPIFPELTDAEQELVVDALLAFDGVGG